MAQTGITSGAGLCIENLFRNAPLTQIGSTTVYNLGITGTNPHRFATVEPAGGIQGKPVITVADAEIDGAVELTRTIHTANDYMGGFGMKFDPEVGYYPLLGIFGVDVQTLLAGGGTTGLTAALQHDFTVGKYAPSFTFEEIFGDGTYGRLTSGYVINSLDLDIGAPVVMKFAGEGYRQIPNTYPNASNVLTKYPFGITPSVLPSQMGGDGTKQVVRTTTPAYVDVAQGNSGSGPLIFGAMVPGTIAGFTNSFLAIDGTQQNPLTVEILSGMTHQIARKVDGAQIAGSGLDKGATTGNGVQVTGKISMYFTQGIQQSVMNFSKFALNYLIPGVAIGTSGVNYSLEVHIPHMKLLDVPVDMPDGPIVINSNYVAQKDPAYGYAIKVRVVNTFDNTTLAGAAGTTGAAGGLGGWSNTVALGATLR